MTFYSMALGNVPRAPLLAASPVWTASHVPLWQIRLFFLEALHGRVDSAQCKFLGLYVQFWVNSWYGVFKMKTFEISSEILLNTKYRFNYSLLWVLRPVTR
jgi:hypothetical protein